MMQVSSIIFGLIIGSFLNVVIYRLFHGGSIFFSRSACPFCHRSLTPWELVPVLSFICLRGRCHTCKRKISWRYPAVELITAITFFLLAQNFLFWPQFVFASFLIVIAVFDLKHYLILDKVLWPAILLAVLVNLGSGSFWNGLFSGLGLAGFFLAQYFISQGRWIGFGDVKLGLLLGLILGWPQVLVGAALAYFSGALVGIGLIAWGKKQFSSKLPFGTFLAFSAIIVMIWGQSIVKWYLNLIGL